MLSSSNAALLLLFIILTDCNTSVFGHRLLNYTHLLNGNYDEIHSRAVIDQIENYIPAQKSLHTRHTVTLDGLYDFCFDNSNRGFSEEWFTKSLRQVCQPDNLYRMPVPSAFNDIPSNRTARDYIGWFWYQTEIYPSKLTSIGNDEEPSKHWFIQFESVNYMAIVWLQRKNVSSISTSDSAGISYLIGSHVGGHLPFLLNITDVVAKKEKSTKFTLTVAVSNLLTRDTIPSGRMLNLTEQLGHSFYKFQPDFDFFHFAGILGSVNLIQLPEVHIQQVDILTHPLQTNDGSSNFYNVCLGGHIPRTDQTKFSLELRVFNTDGEFIGGSDITRRAMQSNLDECHTLEFRWILHQRNMNLNEKLDQFFFPVRVEFRFKMYLENGIDLDTTLLDSSFHLIMSDLFELKLGVQRNDASLDFERRLPPRLGNAREQLQGFGMHHEQLFSGRTMSRAAIMKDMYLLKRIGANVIRTSHYPYSTEYLEACDEFGIMVIAECPAVGLSSFSELKLMLHKQILLEMMQRDHHHSSIIMWSVANEPQSQMQEAKGYFESLLRYVRQDLSQYIVGRSLTAAIAQSHVDDKVAHTLDVIMINRYYGWYEYTGVIEAIQLPLLASLSGWSHKYPGKPLILSEFGADTISGFHSSTRELFTEEYQRDLLLEYERVFDELFCNKNQTNRVNFWGSMIWNFADFSTHDSLLRVGGNKKGIYNSARQPKLSASSIAEVYGNRRKNNCR